MKQALLHIKRNIRRSLFLLIVLLLVFVLMFTSLMMKESGDNFKNIALSNLNIHIKLASLFEGDRFESKAEYDRYQEKLLALIAELQEYEGINGIYYEKVAANGYFTLAENIADDDEFKGIWLSDLSNYCDDIFNCRIEEMMTPIYPPRDLFNYYYEANATAVQKRIAIFRYNLAPGLYKELSYKYYGGEIVSSSGRPYENINLISVENIVALHGCANDLLSLVASEQLSIIEGRYFTKEEIANGANVVILPVGSSYLDQNGYKEKVKIDDMIPISIHNGIEDVYTEYYRVIGFHDGYRVFYRDIDSEHYPKDELSYAVFIPETNFASLVLKAQEVRAKLNLPLQNSYNLYGDLIGYDPYDDIALSDIVITLDNFDAYYPLMDLLADRLSGDHEYYTETNVDDYNTLGGPIASMQTIFDIMAKTGVITFVIIVITMLLNELKKRQIETAIRLSLGENKKHIYRSYGFEYYLLMIIAYILGLSVAKITVDLLRNYLIAKTIETAGNTKFLNIRLDNLFEEYQSLDLIGIFAGYFLLISFLYWIIFIIIGKRRSNVSIKAMFGRD